MPLNTTISSAGSTSADRIERYDIAKLVLVFLVVLGHCIERLTGQSQLARSCFFFIYSFHMPAFLFISGIFSKKNVDQKRYSQIFGFLYYYIILIAILFVYRALVHGNWDIRVFRMNGNPWYFFALFAMQMITIIARRYKRRYVLIIAILFACLAGYDNSFGNLFALNRIIVYYPFFFLGYCLDAERLSDALDQKKVRIISVIGMIAYAAVILYLGDRIYRFRPFLTGRNSHDVLEEFRYLGGLLRLFYYPVVCVLGTMFLACIPRRLPLGKVAAMGRRSLQVYLLHWPAVDYAMLVLKRSGLADLSAGKLLTFVIAILITGLLASGWVERALGVLFRVPYRKEA